MSGISGPHEIESYSGFLCRNRSSNCYLCFFQKFFLRGHLVSKHFFSSQIAISWSSRDPLTRTTKSTVDKRFEHTVVVIMVNLSFNRS